jgi:RNA polymerase sigma-70 factor (ECF subfamily)
MGSTLQNVSPGLIHEAQLGKQESMDRLAEQTRERLFGYIYRLTLDYDLTQDLLQETILFMIQSLNQLEHVDEFWNWLFRTALGKVQHHYRELKRRRVFERSESEQMYIHHHVTADYNDGLTELLRREMSDVVFKAMSRLKLNYRNVLVLRCFENLAYSEIAEVMNCSELQSRVLFSRAKTLLRRQLSVQGFGGRYFLLALAIFGIVTTSAKAASSTTITAASLEVGFTASLLATMSSKIGLVLTAEVIAMALALPLQMFLCAIGVACVAGLCLFLICLFVARSI